MIPVQRKKVGLIFMKKYAIITAAAFMYAVGVSLFTDPYNMAPGGLTGISIILSRFLPVSTGTFIMLLNIP
ncbi:MAG: YitT family protein, partial [Lachnospiraceae bacterium]|nr:YitT family protein [Lachnospiraceae bacterium]